MVTVLVPVYSLFYSNSTIFNIWLYLKHIQCPVSVPNLYNKKILNISGRRKDIKKRKTPFYFTLKGLSNKAGLLIPCFFIP